MKPISNFSPLLLLAIIIWLPIYTCNAVASKMLFQNSFNDDTSVVVQSTQSEPTDNPYRTRYNPVYHWTDSLKWNMIYNVTTYGANGTDTLDDLAAINQAIDAAHTAGGGVVFFPAGEYRVSDTLFLKSGVVLRGANPNTTNAHDSLYNPPSKLTFPKYNPTFSGTGTPNNTAFKCIALYHHQASNIGVVNLDINRAGIHFQPEYFVDVTKPKVNGTDDNYQPVQNNRNCIIFGIKSNNVATPDPGIPTSSQVSAGGAWQRFVWRFSANIETMFSENTVVANCRLNDKVTDTYNQPNYIARSGSNWVPAPADAKTDFNYTDHLGIVVNRGKTMMVNGVPTVRGYLWYPYPWQEPMLFVKGNEVLDNWVYGTMRVKYSIAGNGLIARNNIGRDNLNKPVVYLSPNGQQKQTNYSATYENRFMDFSGFDVLIENNDGEVRNHGFYGSNYRSICGEGIMNQGNSGGSRVNGLIVRNNRVNTNPTNATNPAYSVYRVNDVNNVLFEGNIADGLNRYMLVSADRDGGNQDFLNNVKVINNQVNAISVDGPKFARNVVIDGNTGLTSAPYVQVSNQKISHPSNASLGTNPNFVTFEVKQKSGAATPTNGDALPAINFAMGTLDSCVSTPVAMAVTGVFDNPTTTPDSVVVFLDGVKVANALLTATTWGGVTVNIPNRYGHYFIHACAYKNNVISAWAPTFKVRHWPNNCSPITGIAEPQVGNHLFDVNIFPNPTKGEFWLNPTTEGQYQVTVFDLSGRQILNQHFANVEGNKPVQVNLSGNPKGLYIVRLSGDKIQKSFKIMVE